jgi:hypothetical protein
MANLYDFTLHIYLDTNGRFNKMKKFGKKSMLLDGSGDYIKMADRKDWYISKDTFLNKIKRFIFKHTTKWIHIKLERPKNDLETTKRRHYSK